MWKFRGKSSGIGASAPGRQGGENLASIDYLFEEPVATQLEEKRATARRKKRKLVYDCFAAKVREDRVFCGEGYSLNTKSPDGMMLLTAVLSGRTTSRCQICAYYDDGGETEE